MADSHHTPGNTDQSHVAITVPDEEHPDYIAGTISETAGAGFGETDQVTSDPSGPTPGPVGVPFPRPGPIPHPIPIPQFCSAVSGRYRYVPVPTPLPPPISPRLPSRPTVPGPITGPIVPINLLRITVRVDVDRFYPQQRISIEVNRLFPRSTAHAIAEVTSDVCSGFNRRTVTASITYRDGNAALIPGDTVTFRAKRTTGFNYGAYSLQLSGGGITPRTYNLAFESRYFDNVEFEVDRVSNAGTIVTAYDTGSHPTRPTGLPSETLNLETVYQRAGFDATRSPGSADIPTTGAGTDGTWSDAEMHNAMVTFWSRFSNLPQWAMWVLYAARHDQGRSLGGVMFDDIGTQHRQGTAIFTDSFIQDVPSGDPNAPAWRNRMQFWTAIHEMGHAFNLAHSWQKALGVPQAPGDPWVPLANAPEARSFMNYPFRVSGGQSAFFSDFQFRFTDDELIFMRHAPRRFVQMGNSNWFVNHGFEQPEILNQTGNWSLELRPNRTSNTYRFLEPVTMELKLTNTSDKPASVDHELLKDGRHINVYVQREGGLTKSWRPMITHCHEVDPEQVDPGKSIYGAHMISTSTDGWLIDEPGFYKLQAAVDMGDEIVVSNVLRLYVGSPASDSEEAVALDYFTEDVGRVLAFGGAPQLEAANNTLKALTETCKGNPAVKQAEVALSSPKLRDFKVLDTSGARSDLKITSENAKVSQAAKTQIASLLKDPNTAADTIGHIPYFASLRELSDAMEESGDKAGAVKVIEETVKVMKKRNILTSVIENTEARLKRRT